MGQIGNLSYIWAAATPIPNEAQVIEMIFLMV